MKNLFSAFPLLKKKRFSLFLAVLLLLCAVSGFLYTPEETTAVPSFEEEKAAIEATLDITMQSLENCKESDRSRYLQEKAYYESALKFELSPWGSDFAYEGLSLYASLSLQEGTKEALQKLEKILINRDAKGLYEFCKADPNLPDLDLRLLMTENSYASGKRALLNEIARLEESLATGTDHYSWYQLALSPGEKALYRDLIKQKEDLLLNGTCNPVPLNKESLITFEKLTACLLTVLLLAVAGYGEFDGEKKSLLLFLPLLLVTVLLCVAVLFCTTLIFAPGTIQAEPMQWGGALPFFPALFLRFLCRVTGSLPLMLFCTFLRVRKSKARPWRFFLLLPLLRLLFSGEPTLSNRLSLGDLAWSVFPDLSALSMRPFAPWAGVLLWLLALAGSLWLLWTKEQKITDEKQELSLEKQSEL